MSTKRDSILKLAHDDDEKILIGKLLDKAQQAEKYFKSTNSEFLGLRQQELCKQVMASEMNSSYFFAGGFDCAERKCAIFMPSYMSEGEVLAADFPFFALNIANKWKNELNHRDYLGALMGEGIRREMIGDILVYDGGADVLIMRDVADFVTQNMKKVATGAVKISEIPLDELHQPEIKIKILRDTVASLRLDAVAAVAFSMSRASAAELVKKKLVQVNGAIVCKADFEMSQGMNLSSRGYGKAILASIVGESKKHRQIVEVHKLI